MVKCTFCSNEIPRGTGKMTIKNDGKLIYFCSRKCEKNMMNLKREPVNIKWTKKK